ncbi:MAG: phosphoribosylamine--glycine ligase [Deltaproteobacteria bacterium]|nr:phosphoribosylamine--glycine ligase [Deltaproteobacteria bacterium]
MRVLVVGGGAREHALVKAIARSPLVSETLALPGNAGIAREARCLPGKADDVPRVVEAARAERVDLVVVGPEAPLCVGLVDALAEAGIRAFGPTRAAAELEGSKAFSKQFMKRHGIPTSAFEVFDDADAAERFVRREGRGLVVKADGLAAGKGVVVAADVDEACAAIDEMMRKRAFGAAGARVVIEERVRGQEVSFHAICDGRRFVPLAAAQDHKRIFDGDRGPNTGGMGAYSPPPIVTPELHARIVDEVIARAVRGLAEDGRPFRGALFAGLMIDEDGTLNVLEFNVRFGDPETAVLLARLDADLVPYLDGAARGDLGALSDSAAPVVADPAVAVVVAAAGYPAAPRTGDPIGGLEAAERVETVSVLHAGTATRDGTLVSAGGRVLCVTARGADVDQAAERAYRAVDAIELAGGQHRRDIGASARRAASARRRRESPPTGAK